MSKARDSVEDLRTLSSGDAPTFDVANMTIDDTNLVVADTTNLQTFVEGVDLALFKARATGISTTYVSTVAVGGTTFAQPAVSGEISSIEGYFNINYAGATGVTVADLTTESTYVYIDKSGVLQQQTTIPTRLDWCKKMFTMRIAVDTTNNTILGFEYLNNPIGHYSNSIRDIYSYLLAQGVPFKKDQTITGRAGDLGFDVSAGSLMEFGGTGDIHNANIKLFNAVSNASFYLATRTTQDTGGNTALPKYWDNAGTLTALGSTTVVGHRLYRFSNGNFVIQYGQGNYANMNLAKTGVVLEDYVLKSNLRNATFFGWWFVESTATNTGGTTLTSFVEYTLGITGGSSSGLSGALLKGNNLSDLLDATAARTSLGLGTSSSPTFAGGTLTGDTSHGDNVKAKFGTGDDLQIYHDGNHSYIEEAGTGHLKVLCTDLRINNTTNDKAYFSGADGAGVSIYYNGAERLATTSTGVDISGTVTADNVGIGVVPETWHSNYDVLQISSGASLAAPTSNSSRLFLSANAYINTSNQQSYIATDEASQYWQNAGTHIFNVAPSGTADAAISWTTAMTIDNAGIVTMPYQPSFLAYATADQAIVNDIAVMDFGGTTHNIGGHFSTSTGRFTAPVDGTYHLSAGAIVEGFTPSTYRIMMRFRINGAEVKAAIGSGGAHNSAHDDGEASVSGTMYLNANDYVDIKLGVSGASGTGNIWGNTGSLAWTNFTGHLVG